MIRPAVCALCIALFAGCTSPELRNAYSVSFRYHAPSSEDVLAYPVERVWAVLPHAYADLGFPGGTPMNRREHIYSTPQLRVLNQLYGRRNSEFIDCGAPGVGGRLEDHGELLLAMVTRLEEAAPGRTTVRTQLDAYVRRRDVAADHVSCSSRGVLERAVVSALLARLRPAGATEPGT